MSCAHRGCKCAEASVRRGDRKYCSQTCADVETSGKHGPQCPCGHKDCAPPKEPKRG